MGLRQLERKKPEEKERKCFEGGGGWKSTQEAHREESQIMIENYKLFLIFSSVINYK